MFRGLNSLEPRKLTPASIAREIQQGLAPQGLRDFPPPGFKGIHLPCHGVAGDYYDGIPAKRRVDGFLVADGHDDASRRAERHESERGSGEGVQPRESLPCEHASVER
jgi:hypothetical protein